MNFFINSERTLKKIVEIMHIHSLNMDNIRQKVNIQYKQTRPMVSEEDEVSLVVEGHDSPTLELRVMRK